MTLTDEQAKQVAEAVDRQFPDHWLRADAVQKLADDELVDLELPLWFVRRFKAELAAEKTRRAQEAANQYVWTI